MEKFSIESITLFKDYSLFVLKSFLNGDPTLSDSDKEKIKEAINIYRIYNKLKLSENANKESKN